MLTLGSCSCAARLGNPVVIASESCSCGVRLRPVARDLQWASPITHSKSDLSIPILVLTMEFREVFCRKMVGYEELHSKFMNDVLSTHLFPNRPGVQVPTWHIGWLPFALALVRRRSRLLDGLIGGILPRKGLDGAGRSDDERRARDALLAKHTAKPTGAEGLSSHPDLAITRSGTRMSVACTWVNRLESSLVVIFNGSVPQGLEVRINPRARRNRSHVHVS